MDMLWIMIPLFLFGLVYDGLVSWLHRTGRERGATAWLVVVGVLVTLALVWLAITGRTMQGDHLMVLLLAAFGASGTPMIIGAWKRYTDERAATEARRLEDERRALALAGELLGHDDE
jgi:hypothetical protein